MLAGVAIMHACVHVHTFSLALVTHSLLAIRVSAAALTLSLALLLYSTRSCLACGLDPHPPTCHMTTTPKKPNPPPPSVYHPAVCAPDPPRPPSLPDCSPPAGGGGSPWCGYAGVCHTPRPAPCTPATRSSLHDNMTQQLISEKITPIKVINHTPCPAHV